MAGILAFLFNIAVAGTIGFGIGYHIAKDDLFD